MSRTASAPRVRLVCLILCLSFVAQPILSAPESARAARDAGEVTSCEQSAGASGGRRRRPARPRRCAQPPRPRASRHPAPPFDAQALPAAQQAMQRRREPPFDARPDAGAVEEVRAGGWRRGPRREHRRADFHGAVDERTERRPAVDGCAAARLLLRPTVANWKGLLLSRTRTTRGRLSVTRT